ncbi:Josephin-domain-containing protein [Suillus paluster]|uniref:Josephin-domain-containing protein n=1 Tax=Suillus paluster TaxID=48578 RepID=UPI001B87BA46|nr:Josephin-domain-containing protein [Suillus paluster]KAG1751569.1 Josephin-domain-containing protein [Suillus paluster]
MAGLEQLVQMIYHERQQEGSNLCAQHALNSLLQGNYFTAPDLSEFARKMDTLEESSRYGDAIRVHTSANMDDTGFFSVQVLEEALNVWNLSLIRWRSEAMKPYQDEPHNQAAFVLNQNQHWYTLRRFGDLSNPGDGHWFNLDSTKRQPQWISKLYLGMFLQQAESDGYSIFAVTQIDPDVHSQLPHVDADEIASTFPDPTSAARDDVEPGFENEDMELQAALQASLMGAGEPSGSWATPGSYHPAQASLSAPNIRGSSSSSSTRGAMPGIPPNQDPYGNADVDPITASMERDRILMERMRREQELEFRQQYEEEVARFGSRQPPREPQDDGNEDEHLRRAIADSLAERHARGDFDDDDSEDSDYATPPEARVPYSMGQRDRVYDDDDANFQAALRASLEGAAPEFPPLPIQSLPTRQLPLSHIPTALEDNETDGQSEADTSTVASETDAEAALSMEEMRRRRLARFGS